MTTNNDTNNLKRNERLVFQGPVYSPNTDAIHFPNDNHDKNKVIEYSTTEKSTSTRTTEKSTTTSTTKNFISTPEDNYITEINNRTEIDDDDDDIDFSASFTPSTIMPPLDINLQEKQPIVITNLYAICSAEHSIRMSWHLGTGATSGTHTFPNGTKVQYAECRVVVVTHPSN